MNELRKNDTTKIVVQKKEYKGHKYIDIRTYFFDKSAQRWFPSKKGITVAPRLLKQFIDIVLAVSREKDNQRQENVKEEDIPF